MHRSMTRTPTNADRSLGNQLKCYVSYLLGPTAVVDGNELERRVLASLQAAEEISSNAAEAIDGHLDSLGLNDGSLGRGGVGLISQRGMTH